MRGMSIDVSIETEHGVCDVEVIYWPGTRATRHHPGDAGEAEVSRTHRIWWSERYDEDGEPLPSRSLYWADLPIALARDLSAHVQGMADDGTLDDLMYTNRMQRHIDRGEA